MNRCLCFNQAVILKSLFFSPNPPSSQFPLLGDRLGSGAHGSVTRCKVPGPGLGSRAGASGAGIYAVKRLPKGSTALGAVYAEVCAMQRLGLGPVPVPGPGSAGGPVVGVGPAEYAAWPGLGRAMLAPALVSYGVMGEEYWLVMHRGGCTLTTLRHDLQPHLASASASASDGPQNAAPSPWALLLLELWLECCHVLARVHARGVGHFDVKADNFLLDGALERALRVCMDEGKAHSASAVGADGSSSEAPVPTADASLWGILARLGAAHGRGEMAGGAVVLVDFGESVVGREGDGGDGESGSDIVSTRVRGTLPIQAPEVLAISSPDPSAHSAPSASSAPLGSFHQAPGLKADAWSLVLLGVEMLGGRYLYAGKG